MKCLKQNLWKKKDIIQSIISQSMNHTLKSWNHRESRHGFLNYFRFSRNDCQKSMTRLTNKWTNYYWNNADFNVYGFSVLDVFCFFCGVIGNCWIWLHADNTDLVDRRNISYEYLLEHDSEQWIFDCYIPKKKNLFNIIEIFPAS